MNIQPIKMNPKDARARARVYSKAVALAKDSRLRGNGTPLGRVVQKTDQEREDEALRRAFSALAHGLKVIHLPTVMRQAGVTTDRIFCPCKHCDAEAQLCEVCFDGAVWPIVSDSPVCEQCKAERPDEEP